MRKIANTRELQAKLQEIMVAASQPQPSRRALAGVLMALADSVAGESSGSSSTLLQAVLDALGGQSALVRNGFKDFKQHGDTVSLVAGGYRPVEVRITAKRGQHSVDFKVECSEGTAHTSVGILCKTLSNLLRKDMRPPNAAKLQGARDFFESWTPDAQKPQTVEPVKPSKPARPAKPGVSVEVVAALLEIMDTSTGGSMRAVRIHGDEVSAEPSRRQRLDHYGNNGEGWDSERWENNYATPLRKEVETKLKMYFGETKQIRVGIGEKGHVEIEILPA